MRAIFFGTPAFAVPCLDALCDVADVVGVVCQPDKPQGRGLSLTAPPVKQRALSRGLPVLQPTKLRSGEFPEWFAAQGVDVALVVAYGRILPKALLEAPRLGCVNVHASLLPNLRGAAPITWSVVRGDGETGVTLMQMDVGMDTGAMLATRKTAIADAETAGELSERLSRLGAELVSAELPRYLAGELEPVPQDHARATHAPMLRKEDGIVSFDQTARRVHDHVRGMTPWPGATTRLHGKVVKLHKTRVAPAELRAPGEAGVVTFCDKTRVVVACREGLLELLEVQLEGKKPMGAAAWVAGRGVKEGDRFEFDLVPAASS